MSLVYKFLCVHLALVFVCTCAASETANANGVSTSATKEMVKLLSESTSEASFGSVLDEQLSLFKGQEHSCGHGVDSGFVALVLNRGYVDTAKKLADACIDKGETIDVTDLQKVANTLRRKLTDFTGFLQSANRAMSKVTPAFEWAQSADQVFINVKFAHKLDTPACIDVEVDKMDIQENVVSVTAICKGKKKEFSLVIDLLKPIHTSNSSWSMASVGRGTFTLTKQKPATKWPRLLKSRDKPKNMHVWWQLHEKYEKELEEAVKSEVERKKKELEDNENENQDKQETDSTSDTGAVESTEKKETEVPEIEVKLEEEKNKQKKNVKKAAKAEKKKLKKEKKIRLKEIDAEIAALEKKLKDAKEKKKTTSNEYDTKFSKVDQHLSEDIAAIDKMTEKDMHDKDESGSPSIFQRLKSFLGGGSADSDEGGNQDKEKEKTGEASEENPDKEL